MISIITDSMISELFGWTPTEIFHFHLFLPPRLKTSILISNHYQKKLRNAEEKKTTSNCLIPPSVTIKDRANSWNSIGIASTYCLGASATP